MNFKQKIKRALHLTKKAIFIYNQEGFSGVRRGIKRYRKFVKDSTDNQKRIILDGQSCHYDFIRNFNPYVKNSFAEQKIIKGKKLVINWIVPDYKIGSGGHMTIFRMVRFLEKFGHKNRVYLFDAGTGLSYKNAQEAKEVMVKNFIDIGETEVKIGISEIEDSDISIATSWHTAYPLYTTNNTKQKFYFVQDYEPNFYPMSAEHVFSEQTYKMGYKCITAGPWLTKIMKEKYESKSDYFWLAYDQNIYKPNANVKRKKNKIIFYGRFVTPRRGFELGILALEIVKKKKPDVEIEIYGWDCSNQSIPFKHKNLGILNHKQLANLYSEATVGLVFSMTNYSLIPQEMMGCELPIIEYKGSNTETIFENNENILLAEPNPYKVAEKIMYLLDNPQERRRISKNAKKWVQQFSWEKSARMAERIFYEL